MSTRKQLSYQWKRKKVKLTYRESLRADREPAGSASASIFIILLVWVVRFFRARTFRGWGIHACHAIIIVVYEMTH